MIAWNEQQLMIRDAVRKFVEGEIKPRLEEFEHGDTPPYDVLRKMFKTFGLNEAAKHRFEKQMAKAESGEPGSARRAGGDPARSFLLGDTVTDRDTARAAGYTKMEAFSPFPIHGVDEALGAPRSPLGRIVIVFALLGLAAAVLLQWWTGAVDYKLIIAGKPLFALEPSVPIIFELAVLLSAFAAVLGMFHLNRIPTYYNPFFNFSRHAGASNDRFLLAIEAQDPKFQPEEAVRFLESCGSRHTEVVEA